jgi:hypothetical protein
MFGLPASVLPILVLLVALFIDLGTAVWVHADAKAESEGGTPVVFSAGFLEVDTPAAWFFTCLLMWILFLPIYVITSRNRGG